ncbi:MAG: hypothetical protein J3R72DRAFT_465998 [Linnemannia gamsii]|nr:MAG: hypothetical protein J3R72DRAFT_465998 [Linnemannia gamsii]
MLLQLSYLSFCLSVFLSACNALLYHEGSSIRCICLSVCLPAYNGLLCHEDSSVRAICPTICLLSVCNGLLFHKGPIKTFCLFSVCDDLLLFESSFKPSVLSVFCPVYSLSCLSVLFVCLSVCVQ